MRKGGGGGVGRERETEGCLIGSPGGFPWQPYLVVPSLKLAASNGDDLSCNQNYLGANEKVFPSKSIGLVTNASPLPPRRRRHGV